jgi:hypothetical protein
LIFEWGLDGEMQVLRDRFAQLASAVNSNPVPIDHVFVTAYPDPTTGLGGARCGIPALTPGFFGFDGISLDEAEWAGARLVPALNSTLQAAVSAAQTAPSPHPTWHFVPNTATAFNTHGYCTGIGCPNPINWPTPRWVNTPTDSIVNQGDIYGTMHPSREGYTALGQILGARLISVFAPPPPPPPPPSEPLPICNTKPHLPQCREP